MMFNDFFPLRCWARPLLGIIFFIGGILTSTVWANAQETIRVAVFKDMSELKLTIGGPFLIIDAHSKKDLGEYQSIHHWKVRPAKVGGINIGKLNFPNNRVVLVPKYDATIYVNHRRFRGDVVLIRQETDKLLVVNEVGVEEYIKGVLYHEISHRWPIESIKAQAVAARTYAFYRRQRTKKLDFDVTNDIYSQVYGGKTSERFRTNLAVNRTRGEILMFEGKILPAYFHATCAGHTENVSELWKDNTAGLKGVLCQFCQGSPHYHWKKNFRSKDVQDKLNTHGYRLGLIKEIKVIDRNLSNRVRRLEILTRDGQRVLVLGKDFRQILGPNVIRSNIYDIQMKGYYFDVIGQGWGHGVGFCQWGAEGMSRQRYSYQKILQFYYPGSTIVQYQERK